MAHQNNREKRVVTVINEMQAEIDTLRNTLVRLAVFVGGDPCWCRYAKTGEHTEACRDTIKLKLWARPVKGKPSNRDYLPWR